MPTCPKHGPYDGWCLQCRSNEERERDQLKQHQQEQQRLLRENNEIARRNAQESHNARERSILENAGIKSAIGISASTAVALASIPRMSDKQVNQRNKISQDYFGKFVAILAEKPIVIKPSIFQLSWIYLKILFVSTILLSFALPFAFLVSIVWFILFLRKVNKAENIEIPELVRDKPILAKGFAKQKIFFFFPVSVYLFITEDSFCILRCGWGLKSKPTELFFDNVLHSEIAQIKKGLVKVQISDDNFQSFRFIFYANKMWKNYFEALTMYHNRYDLFSGQTFGDYPIWGGEQRIQKLNGFLDYDGNCIDDRISEAASEFHAIIRKKNL
jgi:hypothetical protein